MRYQFYKSKLLVFSQYRPCHKWLLALCGHLTCTTLLATLTACHTTHPIATEQRIESTEMRQQADSFLRAMPADLQQRQTTAIRKAIDGDNSLLMAVRNARNAQPQISENVVISMVSPTLRLYAPKDSERHRLPLLIYLHGGGWTFGSLNSCGRFCNAIAATGKIKVLAVDYRLAPEHPFPQGLEDCIAALTFAHNHAEQLGIIPHHITVGGDSSGGNLALATTLSASCKGMVESLVLFYPVTKAFADGSASWKRYGTGYGLDAEIMDAFNKAYTQKTDATLPQISMGLCDQKTLRHLPRTLLVAAGRDILCDQGLEFAQKANGRVERKEYTEAVHLFITVPGQDAAFQQAVTDATDFILKGCSKY